MDSFDADEDKLLEYVRAVADVIAPDFAFDSAGTPYATESQAPYLFMRRYNSGKLNVNPEYEDYIRKVKGEERLIDIIESLGIDVEKFWYLLLFVSDYVVGSAFDTLKLRNSPKQDIEGFIAFVEKNQSGYDRWRGVIHKKPMTLTLSVKGRKFEITDPTAISMIAAFCKESISSIHPESILNSMKVEEGYFKAGSFGIWMFAKIFRRFFELYPQFSGQKKDKGGVSRSIMLLISKLAYFVRFTKNEDYNTDDENIKGVLKLYRDSDIDTVNAIYG